MTIWAFVYGVMITLLAGAGAVAFLALAYHLLVELQIEDETPPRTIRGNGRLYTEADLRKFIELSRKMVL